jgi:hypothetical protein
MDVRVYESGMVGRRRQYVKYLASIGDGKINFSDMCVEWSSSDPQADGIEYRCE